MRNVMTTRKDVRNWVDSVTTNWDGRTDADISLLANQICDYDHPPWGTDWTDFLAEVNLEFLLSNARFHAARDAR